MCVTYMQFRGQMQALDRGQVEVSPGPDGRGCRFVVEISTS